MSHRTRVVWSPEFIRANFGAAHPMNPLRLDLTARLCDALGLFEADGVTVAGAEPASDEALAAVHDPGYVAAVKQASQDPAAADEHRGLGTDDDPAYEGMHEASARIFQGSLDAAEQLWRGEVDHAVNFCGGMHHAMRDKASGFCIYNDCAAAILRLLELGAKKVLYIDLDVHHGDGTESFFWDDPRVMTISIHETGRILFPGTGWPSDIGSTSAEGDTVNLALPAGVGDAGWLRTVGSAVPPLARCFRPDVIVTQHGADSHFLDPLAHLTVSVDAQREAMILMHDLAHEICEGKWLALGGGGYEIVDVVPRSWTHLVGIAAHQPVDPATEVPAEWLAHVEEFYEREAPGRMTDGRDISYQTWESGYDPEDPVDRAIMATKRTVFPLHGLDPWFD